MVDELDKQDLEQQEGPEAQATPEASANPPPPPDTVPTQLQTQRILAATAVRTWLEDEDQNRETLTGLLDKYLQTVQFIDPNITPCNIAAAITYATGEGSKDPNRKISPIPSDISERIQALHALKESGESINVAAINIGGTNTATTIATVQNGEITLKELDKRSFRKPGEEGQPIQCTDHVDYWERTIPSEFVTKLKTMTETGETQLAIEIAVAAPTRDGYIDHMSDKAVFERDPLAPANETESRKVGEDRSQYSTIAQSFSKFLEGKGINIPPESIFTGENDTINIVMGNPRITHEILQHPDLCNGIGGLVCGTGLNVCAFGDNGRGFNYEIGHFELEQPCQLDREVSPDGVDIECCVSGKVLGNVLKAAIRDLANPESNLRRVIESMDKDTLNALIFKLADDGTNIPEQPSTPLSQNEKALLAELCLQFAMRAAKYLAATLEGISTSMAGDIVFLKEGSVIERNLWLSDEINAITRKHNLESPYLPEIVNETSQEINISTLPQSFYGAIFDAAAKAYLAQAKQK